MRSAPHREHFSVFCPGWTLAGSHGIFGFMAGDYTPIATRSDRMIAG
jgi:hypothetical protein